MKTLSHKKANLKGLFRDEQVLFAFYMWNYFDNLARSKNVRIFKSSLLVYFNY